MSYCASRADSVSSSFPLHLRESLQPATACDSAHLPLCDRVRTGVNAGVRRVPVAPFCQFVQREVFGFFSFLHAHEKKKRIKDF